MYYYEMMIIGRIILNGNARLDLPFVVYGKLYKRMRQLKTFDVIVLGEKVGNLYAIAMIANNACAPKSLPFLINKLFDVEKKRTILTLAKDINLTGEETQDAIAKL